ncbi:MAG: diphosphate--fructose-6-phosphate 1-phosphotransferase [Dehalococcoidia bacterium]|nr:diphosphate--fructose-6-phosphate 1-phosphotransferase [Dehalococcoidia bacterium]
MNSALVMQSGGCTHVLNRSLYGIASEFARTGSGTLYGAPNGLEGILRDRVVNLCGVSHVHWMSVAGAPGAAIGSTRRRLRDDDVEPVFQYLDRLGIRYWFIIGGNDSAETGHTLQTRADQVGYDLSVINVPKTIDNDLVLTDHCPGYGSAARFVATAVVGSGLDAEALTGASPITILEVMGRDAGWLAAASALARREERDPPHLVHVPEMLVDEDQFVADVQDAYTRYGYAVAVVSENARTADGIIGAESDPWFVDDFGHEYYDGPARYLAALVSRSLGVRARYEKPGTIQRSLVWAASESDVREAEMAGRTAVTAAREGMRDVIVTLEREEGAAYKCRTGFAPLDRVGGKVRPMPEEYLSPSDNFVTDAFIQYLKPLAGDIPHFRRLM